MIQRWKVGCGMFPDKDYGDYVLYVDHLADIKELRERLRGIEEYYNENKCEGWWFEGNPTIQIKDMWQAIKKACEK